MRFKNTTKADDSLLREIVRFVCPPGVTKFSIWFKNYMPDLQCWSGERGAGGLKPVVRLGFCGACYCSRRHVVCRISPPVRFTEPYMGAGEVARSGYLPWHAYTWDEAVVALAAHELRHLWQHKHSRGRVWGARGRQSERDCDAYAIRMVRAWRRRDAAPKLSRAA